MKTPLKFLISFLTLLVATVLGARADSDDRLDRLAPDFVSASLLIASPGDAIYQATGHAALRMTCPSAGLDLVFTYETGGTGNTLEQFLEEAPGRLVHVGYQEYISEFAAQRRGVTAYTLALTPEQKLALWQRLDRELQAPPRHFNVRSNSCMSVLMRLVREAVAPAQVRSTASLDRLDNAQCITAVVAPVSPWANQVYLLAVNSDGDDTDPWYSRLCPSLFAMTWRDYTITSVDGSAATPLVAGEPTVISEATPVVHAPVSPLMASLGLLLFSALLGVAALRLPLPGRYVRALLILLFSMEAAAFLALLVIVYAPGAIGGHFSLLLLAVNPLPLLAILFLRRRPRAYRLFAISYTAVGLAVAALGVALTSYISMPMAIAVAAIAPWPFFLKIS